MKYANIVIVFILLSTVVLFKDSLVLSTNLLSLFAPKDAVSKLSIATELGYTRELLIAVKGFDTEAQKRVETLVLELNKIDTIKNIQYTTTPSKKLQKYYRDNFLLLSDFDSTTLTKQDVNKRLQGIKEKQSNSFFYTPINKNDPLELFSMPQNTLNMQTKGKYLSLGEYGYLLHVRTHVSPSQMDKARVLYADVHKIIDKYPNVIAFSGFFYTVENASMIKEDVTFLAIISAVILLLMYIVLLKNVKILFHTLLALFSSTIFAGLGTLLFFDDFHIISLAFGMSITAVSIDYLFHYYFHDFFVDERKIDKNVLYGFLTTLSAFVIFSFIPVTLIAQISFFTILSLSFSYFLFTFVFKSLKIKSYEESVGDVKLYALIPSSIFIITSFILLVYSFYNIKLDNNIRNLDYQNTNLQSLEKVFKDSTSLSLSPVLVHASTKEELISNLHILKEHQSKSFSLASFVLDKQTCVAKQERIKTYDFIRLNSLVNQEATKLGFRENYFKNTYGFTQEIPLCIYDDLDVFDSLGLEVIENEGELYTLAFILDATKALEYSFVESINVKEMFSKVSEKMYEDIIKYSLFVLFMILILLVLSVKKKFFYALNYILFPLSVTLSVLVSLGEINIMHIFAFIILVAIGIDSGIYMSNTSKANRTILAVHYSLLSTFGAFGVLVFSSIVALHSIGLVISLGVLSIFFISKVMK